MTDRITAGVVVRRVDWIQRLNDNTAGTARPGPARLEMCWYVRPATARVVVARLSISVSISVSAWLCAGRLVLVLADSVDHVSGLEGRGGSGFSCKQYQLIASALRALHCIVVSATVDFSVELSCMSEYSDWTTLRQCWPSERAPWSVRLERRRRRRLTTTHHRQSTVCLSVCRVAR